jgi:very-short-patch-repair endonuclease
MSSSEAVQSMRGELLVAIMRDQRDFKILQEQHWYRIPTEKAPRRLPDWLAFYQTAEFGEEAYAIRYYGHVSEIRRTFRYELFPDEPENDKTNREYFQFCLESIQALHLPILSRRWRRIVFIPTTWSKFVRAAEINDLFDDSHLEDHLWAELKRNQIDAERQWNVLVGRNRYKLDFAVFCQRGNLGIEVDSDQWHHDPANVDRDKLRSNALAGQGWRMLSLPEHKVREQLEDYCVAEIKFNISELGGLSDPAVDRGGEAIVPYSSGRTVRDESVEYDVEDDLD